eukprot:6208697-Pleurochrysis_carterae.AAC.1
MMLANSGMCFGFDAALTLLTVAQPSICSAASSLNSSMSLELTRSCIRPACKQDAFVLEGGNGNVMHACEDSVLEGGNGNVRVKIV